ncbi:MAG: nicotinate (nicotinamide) nucleotide adenylyltransferase [Clostridia bacterium]|nr:nicotinate (nicotinamide) nucleotide adenylyltransferase [Clostridia bacterium]
MRIGILGGTFDPIHNGHIMIAQQAIRELELERLILLPAGQPYHKETDGADKRTRYEMTCQAAKEFGFAMSDFEIKQEKPSYTVESMKYFKSVYPKDTLVFIVGADSLDYVDKWVDSKTLLSMVEIAAAGRGGEDMETKKLKLEREFQAVIHLLHNERADISSSMIRERIRKGEPVRQFLPKLVWTYLKEHEVYENKSGRRL